MAQPTSNEDVFKLLEYLKSSDVESNPKLDKILESLRIACRQKGCSELVASDADVLQKLIRWSGLDSKDPFKRAEATKCLLNIIHLCEKPRKSVAVDVKDFFKNVIRSFCTFDLESQKDELFYRLRFFFICSTMGEASLELIDSKEFFERLVHLLLTLDISQDRKDLKEAIQILFNMSCFETDMISGRAVKYMQVGGRIIDQTTNGDAELITLKAGSLNIFINLSYESLQQQPGLGSLIKLPKVIELVEEVFALPDVEAMMLSSLYLALLNIVDAKEDVRKALRKYILPPKWDRSVAPEDGIGIKANIIRSLRSSDSNESQSAGKLLLALCAGHPYRMVYHVGYGNAAGFLFNNKLLGQVHHDMNREPLSWEPNSSDEEEIIIIRQSGVNPITGLNFDDSSNPSEAMTEAEKEAETEKVLDAFEKLEKSGFINIFKQ